MVLSHHNPNRFLTSERQQTLSVWEEIESILESVSMCAGLYDLIKESLAKTAKLAVTGEDRPWHLLPLLVCDSISGRWEHALPVAAAFIFLRTAAEVYDDIEDADNPESLSARYGTPLAVNTATVLLFLTEQAITRLKLKGVDDSIIVRLIEDINRVHITACAGQHLDISLGSQVTISEELYLQIAAMKSASQIASACHAGALLGTTDDTFIEAARMFGHNLGIVAQIANDIQGITSGNDIKNRKVTLPVIFALAHSDQKIQNQIKGAFENHNGITIDQMQVREMLFRTGAIHYAMIKAELFKQKVQDDLSRMDINGANIDQLKILLE